jgi:hypothetical protein
MERRRPAEQSGERPRCHSDAVVLFRLVRSAAQLPRVTLSGAATVACAVVCMRFFNIKKPANTNTENISHAPTPRPRCGSKHCVSARSNGPFVVQGSLLVSRVSSTDLLVQISLSACSDEERTWEDSSKKGKGMTMVRAFLRI